MKTYTEAQLQNIYTEVACGHQKAEPSPEPIRHVRERIVYSGPGYPISPMMKKRMIMEGGFASVKRRNHFNYRVNVLEMN